MMTTGAATEMKEHTLEIRTVNCILRDDHRSSKTVNRKRSVYELELLMSGANTEEGDNTLSCPDVLT